MRTWLKIVLIAVGALIVLLGVAAYFGASFLTDYAIKRQEVSQRSQELRDESFEGVTEDWKDGSAAFYAAAEAFCEAHPETAVTLENANGLTLSAGMVVQEAATSHRWVLLVHGYRSNHSDMMSYAGSYYGEGYSILAPDLAGHGESEGEYIGMGWPDRADMLLWIDYILSKDPAAEIVLHGVSMGGATVMMTAGEDLPPNVIAIVDDCGYTSVWDIFAYQLKSQFGLPSFPLMQIASGLSKQRAGYAWNEGSATQQVAKSAVPILFIHGSEDLFVPTEMVYEVYEAAACDKELLVVEGAGHGASVFTDAELYWNTVFAFIEKQEAKEDQEVTHPIATIEMEDGGIIKIELYEDIAPNTVKNFIALANSGYYDGVIFHRVISGFMIQGGDPTGTGAGGPGYRIFGEFSNNGFENGITHVRGVISMARQGSAYNPSACYDTAGSQFFIMHAAAPHLDGDYAAFGMVVEGMDVVDAIASCAVQGSTPVTPQVMKTVRVETFGVDYGKPETIGD